MVSDCGVISSKPCAFVRPVSRVHGVCRVLKLARVLLLFFFSPAAGNAPKPDSTTLGKKPVKAWGFLLLFLF
ncbi:hypothetical protein SLEP1_g30335 [Rubroshorea leprosula]|uniref:Uncharacterized protein n=1 Tax=Rubroshorea leprosula TaxID=152421 RepID=A0AAV5K5Y6_9ROSI|nr:hypothetical protein SLEP1_g30335 [Rubroshorea leprosula]